MISLALRYWPGEAAAALAVDGAVRAALRRKVVEGCQTGESTLDGMVFDACRIADLKPEAVRQVVTIDGEGVEPTAGAAPMLTARLDAAARKVVTPVEGILRLVSAAAPPGAALIVADPDGCVGARPGRDGDGADGLRPFAGVEQIVAAARTLAGALGFSGQDAFAELGACAQGLSAEQLADFGSVLTLRPDQSFSCDRSALESTIGAAETASRGALHNHENVHTSVERLRTGLAAGFLVRFAEVLADLAERWRAETGAATVAVGGGFLGNVDLSTEVRRRLRAGSIAPATDDLGAVLGGSLLGHPRAETLPHLALGPSFDEQQIKDVLENCRLEYVYEPDWPRLFERVSRWLAGGRTVAWFQGALDFGRYSLGSRSILADPANRFSRENLNVYLLGRRPTARLLVSLAPSAVADGFVEAETAQTVALREVVPDARAHFVSGLDREGRCLMHVPSKAGAPELVGLLETHRARTGVPGLLNATLERLPGELAETPRDAIRATFGSAVDVLVVGRFLIAKDYWLMRQQED
jgi:predicted NodU family carbamoyl transferase